MRVLITGAGGFLGRHIARRFSEKGHEVTAVFRSKFSIPASFMERANLRAVSVDLAEGAQGLPDDFEAVVHAAGNLSVDRSFSEVSRRDNVSATRTLIQRAVEVGARNFVFLSSTSVYGEVADNILDASSIEKPTTLYGEMKLEAERVVASTGSDLSSAAIRLPAVLGPRAHSVFIVETIRRILAGERVQVANPDNLFNHIIHANDLSDFIDGAIHLIPDGFTAFPVGAGKPITIRDAIDRIQEKLGRNADVEYTADEKRPNFTISSAYATNTLNYQPAEVVDILDRYILELPETPGC